MICLIIFELIKVYIELLDAVGLSGIVLEKQELLTLLSKKLLILQIFEAFMEYMNFKTMSKLSTTVLHTWQRRIR